MKFNVEYKKDNYVNISDDPDIWWDFYKRDVWEVPHPFINILYKYRNQIPELESINTFIETGTFSGFSAEMFSKHFTYIHTVEKFPKDEYIVRYKSIRDQNKNVNFYQGDSPNFLRKIMGVLDKERCVVLLDAHNGSESPLTEELNVLKDCIIKDHVILVDDTCDLGSGSWPTETEFNSLVTNINPIYTFVKTGLGRSTILIY
jgi:hypothetical protein